jgi:sec-independent protein translocase protein TatC
MTSKAMPPVKPPKRNTQIVPAEPMLPEEPEGGTMGFFEHIDELRMRITRAAIATVIGFILALAITNPVIDFMKASYGRPLLILDPTGSVVVYFKVALLLAVTFASPIITYQLLRFIMPGLTRKERRWLFLALPVTTAFFLLGLSFTWTYLIPLYINFLEGFQSDIFETAWEANRYVDFVTSVLFWHAIAFETPIFFYILARLGFATAGGMLRYWRQAIVGIAFISAIITPTVDPVTMGVIMVILMSLYILSIILVFIASRLNPINRPLPS